MQTFLSCPVPASAIHGIKKVIWNGHGYRQSHWVRLTVTVCILFCVRTVGECLSTLERCQPQRWFHDRWMVKTGFCQRQFRQTNEHQRYINKKLNSELHGEVESIQTKPVKKNFFYPLSRNEISSLTLGSRLSCLLSVNMTYRVLLLQSGNIFCLTVNTKNKCL